MIDYTGLLFELQDIEYQAFNARSVPNIDAKSVIGVRIPQIRKLAKELFSDSGKDDFMKQLPHKYLEENLLHIMLVCLENDFDRCVTELECFLPYADNWEVTDQPAPKCFQKNHTKILPIIKKWLASEHIFTARYAMNIFMREFLEADFDIKQTYLIIERNNMENNPLSVRPGTDEYYLHMMTAWYIATALAKQWDAIVPVLQEKRLDRWTHNKSIQKAVESFRISVEQKEYLKRMKV